MLKIFADFNNFDPDGYIRLNCIGTEADIARLGIEFWDGLRLLVSDGDLQAEVIVRQSPEGAGRWRGEILGEIQDL